MELMVLGIDEACTNIIRYAYGNAEDQLIRLTLERAATALRCRLRDYGCPLDACKLNGRALEVVRPGGLGLHLIRQAFDNAYYLRRPKGTELVLIENARVRRGPGRRRAGSIEFYRASVEARTDSVSSVDPHGLAAAPVEYSSSRLTGRPKPRANTSA